MKVFRVLVGVSLLVVMVIGAIFITVHDVSVSQVVIAMAVSLVISVAIIGAACAVLGMHSIIDL